MADPRVFIIFDFDHLETEKMLFCWLIEKFKNAIFYSRLVRKIVYASVTMGDSC
jgi:phosphoserine phosphatase